MTPLVALGRKLNVLSTELRAVPTRMVEAAAVIMERTISHRIGVDAPHRRVAGGPVGVTHHLIRGGSDPAELVKATGPLHLLANPTQPHPIAARKAKALLTPYGPLARVNHPGTHGKNTWHDGVDEGLPLVTAAAGEAAVTSIRVAFR